MVSYDNETLGIKHSVIQPRQMVETVSLVII